MFYTPITDLRRLQLWEINELVKLANEQTREREEVARKQRAAAKARARR